MQDLRINLDRLRADVETLATMGRAESGGLRRSVFSPPYEEARDWLIGRMTEAGLAARKDAAGNVIGRLAGDGAATDPVVMTGSHLDTVPDGGPLDGAFGVLAGLECLRAAAEAGVRLTRPLEVVAFADEEGRFISCMGSRAMAGILEPAQVMAAADFDGNSLAEAMRAAGHDPARIGEARRQAGEIAAYVELHIEQGPVLEHRHVPIGVVEAIVGIDHTDLVFRGEPDHAGTAPMDLRRDAFMGAAHFAARARAFVLDEGGERARLTYGIVETRPQAANIVPELAKLRQEIRHVSDETVDRLVEGTFALAREAAEAFRLELDIAPVARVDAARMAGAVRETIRGASRDLGLDYLDMPSGAGHDAQVISRLAPAGMIFVPSKAGKSHRPDEWTEWPALERGANVLLQTLLRLAAG